MRLILTVGFAAALVPCAARADDKAELVSSKVIWNESPRIGGTDIARFQDRWFAVCCESTDQDSSDGAVRVITSADGAKWESVTLLKSPTPTKGLSDPKLCVRPDGHLMITALGTVPTPNVPDPVPKFGGTVKNMAWYSKDGKTWSDVDYIGKENYIFGRVVWHKGSAYCYGAGCICGIAQTIEIYSNKDARRLEPLSQMTFSGFFPGDGIVFFDGDTLHCLMARTSNAVSPDRTGYLGTAKAPYKLWEWKELDKRISDPNAIRLVGGRVIAAVGMHDKSARTVICELNRETGKLTELLELPTGGNAVSTGLALHDGHLWVSYHANQDGKSSVHLAKVKLK